VSSLIEGTTSKVLTEQWDNYGGQQLNVYFKIENIACTVAHTYNLRYLEGEDQEDSVRPAHPKS
jgi:hypothetical protein